MNRKKTRLDNASCCMFVRAWFYLNAQERKWILLLLALAILGLAVRYRQLSREKDDIYQIPESFETIKNN